MAKRKKTDFFELRFRKGKLYGRIGLSRMLQPDEVPMFVESLQRGVRLGVQAMSESWADTAQSGEDGAGGTANGSCKPVNDHHARAFWRVVLQGLPEFSYAEGRLYFRAGANGMLCVTPLHNAAAVYCHNTKIGARSGHFVYVDNAIDDIRAYVLWAIRRAGIVLETPPGWPAVTDLATPPNEVGEPRTDDVDGNGDEDADGFEEV